MIRSTALVALCWLLLVGCDRDEQSIRVYQAPKQPPPATQIAAAAPTQASSDTEIAWTVPPDWVRLPAQQMRFAAFAVSPDHADVVLTVIPLGPEAGALLPNVNRWQQQIGLPPSPMEDLPKSVKQVTIAGVPTDIVDLTGPAAANPRLRMLAAIMPHGDRVWFFKLVGPVDVVSQQQTAFDSFIQSVHFAGENREQNSNR